jgi:hypothetical protein
MDAVNASKAEILDYWLSNESEFEFDEFNNFVFGLSLGDCTVRDEPYFSSDKDPLTLENSDYSYYENESFKAPEETNDVYYTQEMADSGDNIKIGMLYLNEDGEECEFLGENNGMFLAVGRLTNPNVHARHLHICDKDQCKPIDQSTPQQIANEKQNEVYVKMLTHAFGVECTPQQVVDLMQDNGCFIAPLCDEIE